MLLDPKERGRRKPAFEFLGLVVSLVLSFLAAAVGGWLTSRSLANWYPGLTKPSWNPPDWVFGPVWSLLYFLMAVSAWLVWRLRRSERVRVPLALYAAQLTLNVLWSGIFFALERPDLAFAEVLLLWLTILATAIAFWRVDRVAGALLIPYLAWVAFAAVLNFSIWQLNR